MNLESLVEEIHVRGRDLVDKVRELIHEGNVQRIVVKDEHGNTFVEIPVTVAAVGAILSPLLAAIGAISAGGEVHDRGCPHRAEAAGRRPTSALTLSFLPGACLGVREPTAA